MDQGKEEHTIVTTPTKSR